MNQDCCVWSWPCPCWTAELEDQRAKLLRAPYPHLASCSLPPSVTWMCVAWSFPWLSAHLYLPGSICVLLWFKAVPDPWSSRTLGFLLLCSLLFRGLDPALWSFSYVHQLFLFFTLSFLLSYPPSIPLPLPPLSSPFLVLYQTFLCFECTYPKSYQNQSPPRSTRSTLRQ